MALTDNLEAWWNLEDLTDASGNSHTLTNNNGVTFTAGKINNAATYANSSFQTLSIVNGSLGALNPNGTAYSLSLFFYDNAHGIFETHEYLKSWDFSNGYRVVLSRTTGDSSLVFTVNNVQSVTVTPVTTAAWHHFAASVSATGVVNYCFDGAYASGTTAGAPVTSTGDWASGSGFTGRIDLMGFWTRAITEAEMISLYNSGAGFDPTAGGGGGGFIPPPTIHQSNGGLLTLNGGLQ